MAAGAGRIGVDPFGLERRSRVQLQLPREDGAFCRRGDQEKMKMVWKMHPSLCLSVTRASFVHPLVAVD